jgi:hypothetical protein
MNITFLFEIQVPNDQGTEPGDSPRQRLRGPQRAGQEPSPGLIGHSRSEQLQGEGSRAGKGQPQLILPAQAAYLGEQCLYGETIAAQHQVIEPAIRRASHDFKDLL